MKRLILLLASASLFLTACGSDEGVKESGTKETTTKVNKESKKKLEEVGDVVKDVDRTVTLKKYVTIDDVIEAGPVHITLKEIKFIEMTNLSGAAKKSLEDEGHDTNSPIEYMQILLEVNNTSEDVVAMNKIVDKIVLNTGEQIELFERDMFFEQHLGDIYGGVAKEVRLAPIFESNLDDIETLKFVIEEVYNPETYETIHDTQQSDYTIN